MLFKHGADITLVDNDVESALHFALRGSNSEITKYSPLLRMTINMTDNSGRTPLMDTCLEGGHLDNVKIILDYGADINIVDNKGKSALHFAARDSNSKIIEYLILLEITVNMTDINGQTPLMYACMKSGLLDNVIVLLEYGADINLMDNNRESALHLASRDFNSEIIKYLISLEMIVNMTNKKGQTPLIYACMEGECYYTLKIWRQYKSSD